MTALFAPPPSTARTVRKTWEDIRHGPVARALLPVEAALTLPVPTFTGGATHLEVLAYGQTKRPGQPTELFRPRARLAVHHPSGRCVLWNDFTYKDPFPGKPFNEAIATFPHPAIAKWTIAQYRERQGRLLDLYERLVPSLVEGVADDAAWQEAGEIWRALTPPAIAPYVRALAPAFVDRLQSA